MSGCVAYLWLAVWDWYYAHVYLLGRDYEKEELGSGPQRVAREVGDCAHYLRRRFGVASASVLWEDPEGQLEPDVLRGPEAPPAVLVDRWHWIFRDP